MVPRSFGLVEDVRRGMRVEREGRRRRVVQNMEDSVHQSVCVSNGRPLRIWRLDAWKSEDVLIRTKRVETRSLGIHHNKTWNTQRW